MMQVEFSSAAEIQMTQVGFRSLVTCTSGIEDFGYEPFPDQLDGGPNPIQLRRIQTPDKGETCPLGVAVPLLKDGAGLGPKTQL